MKTSLLLNIILSVAIVVLTIKLATNKPSDGTENQPDEATSANEVTANKEWRMVPVDSTNINSFELFRNAAALTVGKGKDANSMTIGWGTLGILWGGDTPIVTVYVRQSRFTHHLMEQYGTFTVERFAPEYADKLKYLGTASGRDENKIKGCGMTLKTMPNGAPAFEEGNLILECQKLYSIDYTTQNMDSSVVERWYSRSEDLNNIHTAYVGKIVGVWVK